MAPSARQPGRLARAVRRHRRHLRPHPEAGLGERMSRRNNRRSKLLAKKVAFTAPATAWAIQTPSRL